MPDLTERVDKAAEGARLAFWAVIAKSFPEAKTGDLEPPTVLTFDLVTRAITREWVQNNVPGKIMFKNLV